MTTRIKTIAEKCQTEHGAQLHRYSFGYQDASRLSEMILKKSGDRGVLEANAKRLSSKIVDMCDGIPLAVICLSSAWAESNHHLQGDDGEWDTWASHMVMERFLSTPSLTPLVQSLSLGFDHLPVDARTCLLYCSIYPPGYLIQRDCLVRMWIAEGFVWNEEVAEAYFDKFVCMNLLQPVGESTYRVHPLVLACLVCKATEDNFVACRRNNIDPGSSSSRAKQVRRLSLYADHCPDEDFSRTRSLLVGPEPQLDGVPFTKFNQLRVLEIGNRGLENAHLMDICGLIWLRYLGLKWASVEALPEDIGNLRNLETLDVRGTRISELPTATVLEKLQHLRTLNISDTKITELPKDIEKLQLLTTLDISGTNVTELPREIGKLRRLKTLNASGTKVRELPKEVENLEHLETLDISCTEVAYLPKEIGNLQLLEILNASRTSVAALPREIGRLQYLKTLNVSGTKVSDVPKEIGTLQYLRTLDISYTKVKDVPGEITKLERLENLDVRNTCVMELPKEIRNLQRLRTLDVRGTKVRDLLWEVQNPLYVHFGGMYSVKMLKFPLTAIPHPQRVTSSSGANCRKLALPIVFFHPFNPRCQEPLHVPLLRVAGRHMKLPQWVQQDLCNACSLDISLCKLVQQDLEFLKTQMPNLQALLLRLEVLPREPVAITSGGFSKLETFYVDSRLPRVISFEEGAMPKLKRLEFKFYTGTASQAAYSMGITNLPRLETVALRCSEYYTSDGPGIRETIDAVRKEAAEHPNTITLCVNNMRPQVFGRGSKWISLDIKAIVEKEFEECRNETEDRRREIKEEAGRICEQRRRLLMAVRRRAEREKSSVVIEEEIRDRFASLRQRKVATQQQSNEWEHETEKSGIEVRVGRVCDQSLRLLTEAERPAAERKDNPQIENEIQKTICILEKRDLQKNMKKRHS
jgi:Leucine-rich repeat (LRR) protein